MNTDELIRLAMVCFNEHTIEELERIENELAFPSFNSHDARMIGEGLIEAAMPYGDIAVQIVRMEDQAVIFQYIGNTKTTRHIERFCSGKRKTVQCTGHSSLWALAKLCNGENVELSEDCLIVGGGFPVYVNRKLTAIISVSGLHDGYDMEIIVKVLAEYLKIDITEFTGKYI